MMIYKGRKIIAIRGGSMDTNYTPRYILVDETTGEIVDDAQGYGYKGERKAYSAFYYKHRDKTKDGEKRRIKKLVIKFCKDNPELIEDLLDLEFHILKIRQNIIPHIIHTVKQNIWLGVGILQVLGISNLEKQFHLLIMIT